MAAALIVEVLDRRNILVARYRVTDGQATVGRAYDNDVQLDDRYVSPHHARIEWGENGLPLIRDLESRNGIIELPARRRVRELVVPSGGIVQLGESRLRLLAEDHPVEEALELRPANRVVALSENSSLAAALIIVSALGLLLLAWLQSGSSARLTETAGETVALMIGLALWAGAWAFASRIFVGRSLFSSHYAVATAALLLASLSSFAMKVPRFVWPSGWLWGALDSIVAIAILAVALALQLMLVGALSTRRRRVGALVVALVIYGLLNLSSLADDGFDDSLSYDGTLLPMTSGAVHTESLDAMFESTTSLKEKVDSLVDR